MRRCSNCILPETYPKITFDEHGVCNYCRSHEASEPLGADRFREDLQSASLGGSKAIIVPLSGGRDSTYVLYKTVEVVPYKVYAYNFDNGFMSDIAKRNIEAVTTKLKVPLIRVKSHLHYKTRRQFLKLNLQKTPLHFLYSLCYGCPNTIWGGATRAANGLGASIIISGESKTEDAIYKKYHLQILNLNMANKLKLLIKNPFLYPFALSLNSIFQKMYQYPKTNKSKIKVIKFFDYFNYDEKLILQTVQENLDWIPNYDSAWRFDCEIHSLVLQITYQVMGMTEWDDFLSQLVRSKQISRQEAMAKVSKFENCREKLLNKNEELLKRLGLNPKEREKVLKFCESPLKLENTW